MQQINLHRQKLIALAIALLALIFMFLPWYKPTKLMADVFDLGRALGADPDASSSSRNGFHGWGFLSLGGILGIMILSLTGDKTRPFEGQIKQGAMIAFGNMTIGAIISLIDLGKNFNSGVGLYLCMATGLLGLAWVGQFLRNINLGTSPATQTIPTPPPPPPPPPPK
jgi:hypothetical protein